MYLVLSLVHVRVNAMFAWMSLSDWRTAGRIERSERGRKGKAEKVIMQYTLIYYNVPLQHWFFTSKYSAVLVSTVFVYCSKIWWIPIPILMEAQNREFVIVIVVRGSVFKLCYVAYCTCVIYSYCIQFMWPFMHMWVFCVLPLVFWCCDS